MSRKGVLKMLWAFLAAAGLLVLAVAMALVSQVDDWSRDLTHNHAATSDTAGDEVLRPVPLPVSPAEAAAAVEGAAARLPGWTLARKDDDGDVVVLSFVRTTPLWRFKDDNMVRITADGSGSTIHAESRSRVGKGDLGQNPRNLKELLGALRAGQA